LGRIPTSDGNRDMRTGLRDPAIAHRIQLAGSGPMLLIWQVLLALVFPSLAYLLLRRTPSSRTSSVRRRKATAGLIVAIGTALMPICFGIAVGRLLDGG
jgi:cytochrome bd-type quinol oxidase subunit 2